MNADDFQRAVLEAVEFALGDTAGEAKEDVRNVERVVEFEGLSVSVALTAQRMVVRNTG